MRKRIGYAVLICGMTMFGGCASSSDKIAGQYISPLQYQNYSCAQLGEEAQRISGRVAQMSGAQDQKATSDAVATAAAIVIFWPAAFFVGGNDQTTAELSRLKGEFETVEKDTDRDRFMSAEDAKAYGLVDHVVSFRKDSQPSK
jgi:hypothetical protein